MNVIKPSAHKPILVGRMRLSGCFHSQLVMIGLVGSAICIVRFGNIIHPNRRIVCAPGVKNPKNIQSSRTYYIAFSSHNLSRHGFHTTTQGRSLSDNWDLGEYSYSVSQKKSYLLKSSASAACSNLNALTPYIMNPRMC